MNVFYLNTEDLDDEKYNMYLDKVSEYRRNKVQRLKFLKDRKLSLASGILLYKALFKYNICEENCTYLHEEHGKPYLKEYSNFKFNLSHSGSVAVIVFDNQANNYSYGIDVEMVKPFSYNVAERILSKDDFRVLNELKGKASWEYFAKAWTRREAYGKMTGRGLDFSDDVQKQIMNSSFFESENIFFKEFKIINDDEFIVNVCSDNQDILNTECICVNI